MTTIVIRIINTLAVAALLVGVLALLSSVSTAQAGDRPLTQRERECWDNPRTVSPRSCFEAHGRSM